MYTSVIGSFLNSIQALKFYVDSVEPMSLKVDEHIDDDSIMALLMLFAKDLKVNNINLDDISFSEELSQDFLLSMKKTIEKLGNNLDVSKDGKIGRYKNVPKSLKESYRRVEAIYKQNEILYSGSLMLLVTYFENTVSKILKTDFQAHPERVALDKKMVPYKILEMSGNIEDVKYNLIENEVTTIMYKSVSDWIEYFKKNLKLSMTYVTEVLPDLIEIIARRNLIVHNEGIVNTTYLSLVPEKYALQVKTGEILDVDKQYIYDAINLIELVGVAIIIEIWLNESARNQEEVGKILAIIFDEYLIFERWEDAKVLYEICLKCKKMQNSDLLVCRINRWQCYKWLGEFEKVKKEVEELDVSAYNPMYRLGKLALLDDEESFFKYFDNQEDIGEEELETWPLFRGIRESKFYLEKYIEDKNKEEV